MKDRENEDFDYGHGITQKDVDEFNNKPKYLHNQPVRDKDESFADFVCKKPFLDGYSEEEKKKIVNEIRVAGGLDEVW